MSFSLSSVNERWGKPINDPDNFLILQAVREKRLSQIHRQAWPWRISISCHNVISLWLHSIVILIKKVVKQNCSYKISFQFLLKQEFFEWNLNFWNNVHRPDIQTFKHGHDFPILSFEAINQGEKQVALTCLTYHTEWKNFAQKTQLVYWQY